MEKNVLYVNKPAGITSFDVCYRLRKVLNTKKIGHTGTLDPNATGVMIILFNKATKANQFLLSDRKQYKTRVLLGTQTDSLDIDGSIIKTEDYIVPSKQELHEALNSFLGRSKQTVPITSAKSVNGKRLYQYQLQGKQVVLPIININVYDIRLDNIYEDGFEFTCDVSSGTYIRSLVQDILIKLNQIGTVKTLCRTKIDNVKIEDCDTLENILNNNFTKHSLLDVLQARYICFEIDNVEDIKNGKRITLDSNEDRILLTHNNEVLAMYKKDGNEYICERGLW